MPQSIADDLIPNTLKMHFDKGSQKYWVWKSEDSPENIRREEDTVVSDGMQSWDYNKHFEHDRYLGKKAREDDRRPTPEGDDLALLPRRIVGYALWERKFVQIDVLFLQPAKFVDGDNPFDKLQIPVIQRTLIQSVVTSHFVRNDLENSGIALGTQDIIRGKGKGVVILLHGVPGVGKTATAEAGIYSHHLFVHTMHVHSSNSSTSCPKMGKATLSHHLR